MAKPWRSPSTISLTAVVSAISLLSIACGTLGSTIRTAGTLIRDGSTASHLMLASADSASPARQLPNPDVQQRIAQATVIIEVGTCSGQRHGTGVTTAEGTILTNAHVVKDANSARATFGRFRVAGPSPDSAVSAGASATTVGTSGLSASASDDLATLRFEPRESGHDATSPEPTKGPHPGQRVIIAGYPRGQALELRAGNITATANGADYGTSGGTVWRSDVAVHSGDSGSGVFTQQGDLIGIVFSKANEDGTAVIIPASRFHATGNFKSVRWTSCPVRHPGARQS